MTYLEQLRLSKDKATVAFHEFALSTKSLNNHLFCFFEGKDNAYYIPRIKPFTSKIKPIICGGREKLLKVYELIQNQYIYAKYRKAFFIDRDFNIPRCNTEDSIFETPCYSIENFYVNQNTFKDILIHEFHLSESNDEEFSICLSLFIKQMQEFHKAILLFNSWYACLIDKRNNDGILTGVTLGEKMPKGFIDITLHTIQKKYDFEKIKRTFPEAKEISEDELFRKISEFEKCDAKYIFRGKYQLEFLIAMIQQLVDDSKKAKTVLNQKIKFSFDGVLTHERALSIFSSYAETPEALTKFLEKRTQ